ncbi:glycosyltransferase [Candidatus Kryptobacter tengchongensis]|uniref:Glycosyl transferase 4-like n=1 Tax=Kryptobacter tengchongensis TaxID=1643429 RepID=A0A656D209_KRYT1|nr:glycosyltransferase [Candidatus Kryptobacter tengchongensis]CUS96917.1 Glycosyl transferase 4-like [Candidatus Kryptobacter tengchongensis]
MKRSKILIIFLGNPAHDSRSLKIFKSLSDLGYTVRIICAHQPGENFLNHPCILYAKIKSFKRAFFRILMFYIKALPLVLKEKTDIVIASDLFSLPLAWLASKKNNKAKLVYDSREIYSALASLHRRKFKQWLITKYETFFALNSNLILTVNESLNKFLSNKFYNKKIHTLHNFPPEKR